MDRKRSFKVINRKFGGFRSEKEGRKGSKDGKKTHIKNGRTWTAGVSNALSLCYAYLKRQPLVHDQEFIFFVIIIYINQSGLFLLVFDAFLSIQNWSDGVQAK